MKLESPNQSKKDKELKDFIIKEGGLDPDFERKYNEVKPTIDEYEKSGKMEEAREKARKQKIEDNKKIQEIRKSLGLEPEDVEEDNAEDSPSPDNEEETKYKEVINDKNGRRILFDRKDILENSEDTSELKYKEVRNEKTGRRILFSLDDIKRAQDKSFVEDVLKVPNELANGLKKEEELLTYITNERSKVESDLDRLKDPQYVDSVIDQYEDKEKAGRELKAEHEYLTTKLEELKIAEQKTKEAIEKIEEKLK